MDPDQLEMISIPPGSFWMGTSEAQIARLAEKENLAKQWQAKGRFKQEQPFHLLSLPGYRISKHTITVGQYQAFIAAGGYQQNEYWTAAGWAWRSTCERALPELWEDVIWAGDERLPVVGVCWYEAAAFCIWLSTISGSLYRLPSEAEWEQAARGSDGRLYPWGDRFETGLCNTREAGQNRTCFLGHQDQKDQSPYGCIGMAGNVSEWTLSIFAPYPYNSRDGREDENSEGLRVIRGGSWFKPALRARTAARGMNDPFFADSDVGFRIVTTP